MVYNEMLRSKSITIFMKGKIMAIWEGRTPTTSADEERSFLLRLRNFLILTARDVVSGAGASRVDEAIAETYVAESKLKDYERANRWAETGDAFDTMQLEKRKLRMSFEAASRQNSPPSLEDAAVMTITYSKLIEKQAAQPKSIYWNLFTT